MRQKSLLNLFFLTGAILLLSFLFLSTASYAGTLLSGEVTGILSIESSPFLVTAEVYVPTGEALTIEPGVIISFEAGLRMDVWGTLNSIGTPEGIITFTSAVSPAPGDWDRIRIRETGSATVRYSRVEYSVYGLHNFSDSTVIENCTFETNSQAGIWEGSSSGITIQDCVIKNNGNYGIYYVGRDEKNSTVKNCLIINNVNHGLYLIGAASAINRFFIQKNTISESENGIYCNAYVFPTITENNITSNEGTGISLAAGNYYIFFNNIKWNETGINANNNTLQTIIAYGNNFIDNTTRAIKDFYYPADFTRNYWGSSGGPSTSTFDANSIPDSRVVYEPWISSEVENLSPSGITSLQLFTNKSYSDPLSVGEKLGVLQNIYIEAQGSDPDSGKINWTQATVKSPTYPTGIKVDLIETDVNSGKYRGSARIVTDKYIRGAYSFEWLAPEQINDPMDLLIALPEESIQIYSDISPEAGANVEVAYETTWKADDNPQRIMGFYPAGRNFTVAPQGGYAVKLAYDFNIEPGVRIEFGPFAGICFERDGNQTISFSAIGTPEGRITFTTMDPSPGVSRALWNNINFYGFQTFPIFKYCDFSHGGRDRVVYPQTGSLVSMSHCNFFHNQLGPVASGPFYFNNVYNNAAGILGGQGVVVFNNIYDNNTQAHGGRFGNYYPYNYWGGGAPSDGGVLIVAEPHFDKPVDPTQPATINSLRLFLDGNYTHELGSMDDIGFFDTLFVSIEASDPSSEAFNVVMVTVEADSTGTSVQVIIPETAADSGIYNRPIHTNPASSSDPLGGIKVVSGDTLKVSAAEDPAKYAELTVTSIATWEEDENPKFIFGTNQVHHILAGHKLYIDPGVTAECFLGVILRVDGGGRLEIRGEENKPVTFQYIVPTMDYYWQNEKGWGDIRYIVGSGSVEHAVIKHAGIGFWTSSSNVLIDNSVFDTCGIAVNFTNSSSILRNSRVTNCRRSDGIVNINGVVGNPSIDRCLFYQNIGNVIVNSATNANVTIKRSTIESSSMNDIKFEAGTAYIYENRIRNAADTYFNIFLTDTTSSSSKVNYNIIDNDVGSSRYGIYYTGNVTVDAQRNYWGLNSLGQSEGPYSPDNLDGNDRSEAAIYPYVDYSNWLTNEAQISIQGPIAENPFPQDRTATKDAWIPISVDLLEPQDQPINASTILLRVNGTDYDVNDTELDYNDVTNRITFTPSSEYSEGTIEAYLLSAEDIVGNPLQNPYPWSFYLDYTSPEVGGAVVDPSLASSETITVTVSFSDLSGMNTSEGVEVSFVPSGEITGILLNQTSFAPYEWIGTGFIAPETPNGGAKIKVAGGEDKAGNPLIPSNEAGNFFIDTKPPTLEVTRPLSGEVVPVLQEGSTYNIQWQNAIDPVPSGGMPEKPISIYYSIDGGSTYPYLITSETADSGSYSWTLPFLDTTEARVLVYAKDLAGNISSAESQNTFEIKIQNPYIVSTFPEDGETNVWTGENIGGVFSRWMDKATVLGAVSTDPPAGTGIFYWVRDPDIEWHESVVFDPDTPLAEYTTYIVTIGADSTDLYGYKLLGGDYTFSFTTGGPDTGGPIISPVLFNSKTYVEGADNIMLPSPLIEAKITDEGSGVNGDNIVIKIDGTTFIPPSFSYDPISAWLTYEVQSVYGVGLHYVTIEARDLIDNISTWEGILRVKTGPEIDNVRIDDRAYVQGDIISSSPKIQAEIKDHDAFGQPTTETVDPSSITIEVGPYTLNLPPTVYDFDSGIMSYELRQTDIYLGPATYILTIEASDIYGNSGSWSGYDLKIMSGNVQTIGPVLSYPTPFKPLSGTPATIAYTLNVDASIAIYLYDVSGQIVLTKKFPKGLAGGRAGYNSFTWNGTSDFGGVVGNGIYLLKITSGDRVVGTGKIVVFE